jgi:hypothetical protein
MNLSESDEMALRIFRSAQQFQRAHGVLYSSLCAGDRSLSIPDIVISALVFELNLKCLVVLDSRKLYPSSHKYTLLFKKLSGDTQAEIRKRYANVPLNLRFKETIDNDPAFRPIDYSLDGTLRASEDAFVLLRYVFEKPGNAGWYCGPLLNIVADIILERRPQWGQP